MGNNSGKSERPATVHDDNNPIDMYVDIMMNLEDSVDIAPIKAMLNDHISSSAIDTIRDSQVAANELAKTIIIEYFDNKQSAKQFGDMLSYTFSYESVLKPTRDLLFWSIDADSSKAHVYQQAKAGLYDWCAASGKDQLAEASSHWLRQKDNMRVSVSPMLLWSLRQKTVSEDPLADVVVHALPFTKAAVVDSLQYYALEALKSEDTK